LYFATLEIYFALLGSNEVVAVPAAAFPVVDAAAVLQFGGPVAKHNCPPHAGEHLVPPVPEMVVPGHEAGAANVAASLAAIAFSLLWGPIVTHQLQTVLHAATLEIYFALLGWLDSVAFPGVDAAAVLQFGGTAATHNCPKYAGEQPVCPAPEIAVPGHEADAARVAASLAAIVVALQRGSLVPHQPHAGLYFAILEIYFELLGWLAVVDFPGVDAAAVLKLGSPTAEHNSPPYVGEWLERPVPEVAVPRHEADAAIAVALEDVPQKRSVF